MGKGCGWVEALQAEQVHRADAASTISALANSRRAVRWTRERNWAISEP
jgi:hypothetical protein